jgi:hypothetical protein
MKKFDTLDFFGDFWLNVNIKLFSFLLVFIPISTIISQLILAYNFAKFWLFWKEFLVFLSIFIWSFWLYKKRNFLTKSSLVPLGILLLMTFWIVIWSFWQGLTVNIILLGFRFELWWLYFWAITYIVSTLFQNWHRWQIQYNQKDFDTNSDQRQAEKSPNSHLISHDHSTKNETQTSEKTKNQNKLSNNILVTEKSQLEVQKNISKNKLWLKNTEKTLRTSLYLGFFLVVLVFLAGTLWGQETVLSSFGFENNNSQTTPQVCHLVDFGENSCRLSAGFASPNHLAAYLLLVLPIFWFDTFKEVNNSK